MDYLLDTHVFLWIFRDDPRLKPRTRKRLEKAENIYFSPVNLFEIAILKSLGRLATVLKPTEFREEALALGMKDIELESKTFDIYETLPLHHRDPHDRLLIAQAKHSGLTLMTADPWFKEYGIKVESV